MSLLALLFISLFSHEPTVRSAAELPPLFGTDGKTATLLPASGLTVITFFSAHCACQRAHEARLREWYAHYQQKGVRFWLVDSEADSSFARDEQQASHYPFPILRDDSGVFADYFSAEYATYSVILDSSGKVVYRGGLDSDKQNMKPSAHLWVKDALDRLLAGTAPEPAETKALGCVLRRR